jgi:hypothetical protein
VEGDGVLWLRTLKSWKDLGHDRYLIFVFCMLLVVKFKGVQCRRSEGNMDVFFKSLKLKILHSKLNFFIRIFEDLTVFWMADLTQFT